jgi:hypothetical protein
LININTNNFVGTFLIMPYAALPLHIFRRLVCSTITK